jgi:hypothetical protein
MRLTIYFDGQFWVGVFEEVCNAKLKACRCVFGLEPGDADVLELVNRRMLGLIVKSSQLIATKDYIERKINPKRVARLAAEEMNKTGISTKAQLALQLEHEQRKKDQVIFTKQQKEALEAQKWELRKEKAKEKHRGR